MKKTRRRRRGSGKRIGGAYERKIAGVLGEWWCEDAAAFWRTAGSGARATVQPLLGLRPGDIAPIHPAAFDCPFMVECKDTNQWSFDQLLREHRRPLVQYWSKLLLQCPPFLVPVLIFRGNRTPDFIGVEASLYRALRQRLKHLPYILYADPEEPVRIFVFRLVEFLCAIPPNAIRKEFPL